MNVAHFLHQGRVEATLSGPQTWTWISPRHSQNKPLNAARAFLSPERTRAGASRVLAWHYRLQISISLFHHVFCGGWQPEILGRSERLLLVYCKIM